MKTYLKKDHKGYYVLFTDEIDAEYWAGRIGSTYDDFRDNKWIPLSDEQLAFHEAHPSASVKNVIEMNEPVEYQPTLEDAKAAMIETINRYDNSEDVNSFNVQSNGLVVSAWLTPAERSNYRSSIDAAEVVGLNTLSFYIGDIPVTLPTEQAKLLLAQIQLYADQCFMVTKAHIAAVEELDSIEAVNAFDYTTGYPEKLTFNV